MLNYMRLIGCALIVACGACAAPPPAPKTLMADLPASAGWRDLPTDYTEGSTKRYDMADLDLILANSIYHTGPSERKIARRPGPPPIGTRISVANTKATRLEANRILLHVLNERHEDFVYETVERLAKLPSLVPLSSLSSDAQLAYWLNLRTAMVYQAVMDIYPITDLERVILGEDSFAEKPMVTVLGVDLSIRDIEFFLMTNWDNPLVAYGFSYGVVGSPNFRTSIYRDTNVWQLLRQNAAEFVNSLRGIWLVDGSEIRVSWFFNRYPKYFDVDSEAFIEHLRSLSDQKLRSELQYASSATPNVYDWSIADIVNGRTYQPASLIRVLGRDGRSRAQVNYNLPHHARELLEDIGRKNYRLLRQRGGVTIENVNPGSSDTADKANADKQQDKEKEN